MRGTWRRSLGAGLLALCLCLSLLPTVALAADGDVEYVKYTWDENSNTLTSETETLTEGDYTLIDSPVSDEAWGEDGLETWHVIQGTVNNNMSVVIHGSVNIILADGCNFTTPRVILTSGNTLTIYGQTAGSGTMTANGSGRSAGIGTTGSGTSGTLTIHGGIINAVGDDGGNAEGGAGIGGAAYNGCGNVTIYSGVVKATGGEYAAGIGGGATKNGGEVSIYGGTVTAAGKHNGAGIGGGSNGRDGTLTIKGGAFVVASSIGDDDDTSGWDGVVFNGTNGQIYGDTATVSTNAEIPAGYTLTISEGQTLTVTSGATLAVKGGVTFTGTGNLTVAEGGALAYYSGANIDFSKVNGDIVFPGLGEVGEDGSYTISTEAQLRALAEIVDNGYNFKDKTVVLDNDIDLSNEFWNPIGEYNGAANDDTSFCGTFDGKGHTISGMTITNSTGFCGLFARVGTGGTVENLAVEGSITAQGANCGSIACSNAGTISNCYSNVDITAGYDERGTVGSAGGIVYFNSGNVSNCYSIGDIEASIPAGICVKNYGGTITDCYNFGELTLIEFEGTYISSYGVVEDDDGTVTGCYYLTGTATTDAGGSNPLTAAYFADKTKFTGWNFADTWQMDLILGRPVLQSVPEESGVDIEDGAYIIRDAEDLEAFRDAVNSGRDFKGVTVKLKNNIDLNNEPWTPIGSSEGTIRNFSGIFDGNGYTISGLYIKNSGLNNAGLFGYVSDGGKVQNLGVSGTIAQSQKAGGIAAVNKGTISSCFNAVNVNASNTACGIAYSNSGTIENCYNIGQITSGFTAAGITTCEGSYIDAVVKNCYNYGNVNETAAAWAIANSTSACIANCCYLEGTGEGVNGATQLSAAQFSDSDSFSGWFGESSPWVMDLRRRPVLKDVDEPEPEAYNIYTAEQLEALATEVNNGETFAGVTFELMNDIDLGGDADTPWTPIGAENKPFSGTFNGNCHTISGLYVDDSSKDYAGLFGYTNGAAISALCVEGEVTGDYYVGGIAGNINNTTISNCCNKCSVSGTNYVGGIAGSGNGKLERCLNVGTVSASGGGNYGGLMGSGVVQESFYLDTSCDNKDSKGTSVTAGQLTSGEVAYKLQGSQTLQYWGQKLTGETKDTQPVLGSTKEVICIFFSNETQVVANNGTAVYTNPGNSVTAPETTPIAPVENAGFTGWADKYGTAFDPDTVFNENTDFVACFQFNAPAAGEGFTVDYADETVTPDEGFAVSLSVSGGAASGDEIDVEPGDTVYVFRPEGEIENILASGVTVNTLPGRPDAPDVKGGAGKITGTDTSMEYSTDGGATWTACAGEPVTGLEPGEYQVRYAATGSAFAGESVTVTVTSRVSGNPSDPTYRPDVEQPENGEVTVSPRNPERGDDVTITPAPEAGYEVDEVTVIDRNGNEVEVTENRDGTWTFEQPRGRVTISVAFREIPPEPLPFTDVPEDFWAYNAIQYVCGEGLMAGTSGSTFSPEGTTTRGQIVTILWRLSDSPVVNYLMDYSDVDPAAYYAEAIRWATSEGIVGGYGGGVFGPNDPITREQLAVMLYRYAQHEGLTAVTLEENLTGYADADSISPFAIQAMNWAVGAGIIGGTSPTTLAPQGTATRAQAAVMLMRFCKWNK